MKGITEQWNAGDPYEYFMGRWSSVMAPEFLRWLNAGAGKNWLDVGCGTGALSQAIEKNCSPQGLSCMDPSEGFIEKARQRISTKAAFRVGSVDGIPFEDACFDTVVSGLAFNFFPDPAKALAEMKRVSKPDGVIAAYVWDYAGRMDFLRYFWDAACEVVPDSKVYDEGLRFPICDTGNLSRAFTDAGLHGVESSFLDIETVFTDFQDYWNPFLGGQGPAPGFLMGLEEKAREAIKEKVKERMKVEADGSIRLTGRALVVRGLNKNHS